MTHAERIREYVKTVGEWDDCMATYAALLAGAEALERESWRPISEAPKNTWVLLWWPHWSVSAITGIYNQGHWHAEIALLDEVPPTHWRPLPQPPKEG